jgi:TolB-like protein
MNDEDSTVSTGRHAVHEDLPNSSEAFLKSSMPDELFAFGPFVLDASRGVLERDGAAVPLGRRAMGLLVALVRADGHVLTKDELTRLAWPSAVVEDSNLSVQIAALRKALGTMPEGGDYIGTVARLGYRFGARIARVDGGRADAMDPAAMPSIVVLPLVNLSGDAGQQYVADGVTEDIIMALSRFRWFRVIGRHASFAFDGTRTSPRDFARQLGVRYVLEGSVRRRGDRVAIAVRLVDAGDDSQLWGEHFDLELDRAGVVHDTIAQRVAGAAEPELLKSASAEAARRSPVVHASVRDLVHRGTWLFHQVTRETHWQARELFREACRLDPAFGASQFWLARASAGGVASGWSADAAADLREGREAAAKAIHADGKDPYAHYSLAIVSVYAQDLQQARRAAERSVQLAPAFALGHLVRGMALLFDGDAAAASTALAEGLRLNRDDPQNFAWFNLFAYARLFCGEPEEALDSARQAQEVRPGWTPALQAEACCLVALERVAAARAALARTRGGADPTGDALAPLRAAQPAWARQFDAWRRRASVEGLSNP